MIHSFSGSPDIIKSLLQLDVKIFFSFSMKNIPDSLFKHIYNKKELNNDSELLKIKGIKNLINCPLENLMLETDSPYQISYGFVELLKNLFQEQEFNNQMHMNEFFKEKFNTNVFGFLNNELKNSCCSEKSIKLLNFPFYLSFHYQIVASLKNISVADLSKMMKTNIRKFAKI